MTTNQTIDGVPRDDLELVLLHGHSTHESDQAWDRLRALLEAPAAQWLAMEVNGKPWVIKEGPNADKWRAMGYELFPVEPAGQNQGEPVAWQRKSKNEDGRWFALPDSDVEEAIRLGYEVRKLYAEQPAPIAVALPERREMGPNYPYLSDLDIEWNACLDEVVRLTATVRIPERLVMTDGLHTYEYVTGHNAAIDKMLGVKS
ncbi:hypothetical protein JFT33_06130 [Pseudomonas carnis]|uniref:hypothetical protein n=1 Tax=Pseudomonas carnis TaxID=2487355 RepID=UPI0018E83D29|nr:hypothetical protein [Pseudomonas carnis]MBJ2206161.1 hypothetical protein [Pseudomonas carnis]